jgi:hypothetical protein
MSDPAASTPRPHAYPYRWRLRKQCPERWGTPCRIVHDSRVMRQGPGARVLVEFSDGTRVETVRLAVRKARGLAVAPGGAMAADNRVAAPARAKPGR